VKMRAGKGAVAGKVVVTEVCEEIEAGEEREDERLGDFKEIEKVEEDNGLGDVEEVEEDEAVSDMEALKVEVASDVEGTADASNPEMEK
jgi:hypothetical protein